jgi:hypothetical protein
MRKSFAERHAWGAIKTRWPISSMKSAIYFLNLFEGNLLWG